MTWKDAPRMGERVYFWDDTRGQSVCIVTSHAMEPEVEKERGPYVFASMVGIAVPYDKVALYELKEKDLLSWTNMLVAGNWVRIESIFLPITAFL